MEDVIVGIRMLRKQHEDAQVALVQSAGNRYAVEHYQQELARIMKNLNKLYIKLGIYYFESLGDENDVHRLDES